ncbi:EcsC family protein [Albidovulum inexpectatum]|uniref:EcsC family protein n=1 Tax=Albidovulum inexpectatum TaxID=196587 RepID=A0A2S5JI35_9RHOB|nr:EcsC family protein [Albidovulum inexpectatum]PPB81099.1 EcsC family protein [Albidovulum inexpectatum]
MSKAIETQPGNGSLPDPGHSLPPQARARVADYVRRMRRANGPVIRAINSLGGGLEKQLNFLPPSVARLVMTGTEGLLERAYHAAGRIGAAQLPDAGNWGHAVAAATGGALGGMGGLGTALVELPATVTLFFSAMQKVAQEHGFAPESDETRLACLEIFGAGGPLADDDGVNTAFLGARLALSGRSVQVLIQQVAPGLAAVLTRKLASQAVPVLGAAAGAGVNLAFLSYYREMAHVRFGLMRLSLDHGHEPVEAAFRRALLDEGRKQRVGTD